MNWYYIYVYVNKQNYVNKRLNDINVFKPSLFIQLVNGNAVELFRNKFTLGEYFTQEEKDIDAYVSNHFNDSYILKELTNSKNLIYLMFDNDLLIGYSKFVLNTSHDLIEIKSVCKLERIYLSKTHYGSGLSNDLLSFVIEYSKNNDQAGIWLNVWTENKRAINFYNKTEFKIIGDYQFQISTDHSNPNYVMYLEF